MRQLLYLCLCWSVYWLLAASFSPASADTQTVQSSSFDSNGVKIAYVIAGEGEPVVLVHGLYSSAAKNWQLPGTFKLLAQHYQVAALDLRGHGNSDKPTDDADYGEPMVDDITRLMDHLKIEKAHIVGYSLGGIIVMKFIIEHPDRVRSAALGGMGWLREGGLLPKLFGKMGGGNSSTPPACAHAIGRLAVTEDQIKSIKVPLEILVGDHDPCKRLYVDPLTAVRSDIPVVVINDAGHVTCTMKEQFKQGLLSWIDHNAGR